MSGLVSLLGLAFADLDAAQAAAWIAARPHGAPFSYVVTPNADHLVRLARQPELRGAYAGAGLCLLDSRVVAAVGRGLGLATPVVAPGSDVTAVLLARHVRPDEPVTIIGLRRPWLPRLMARCGLRRPPWHYDPPIGFEQDRAAMDATVAFVLAHPSRFVFLAVGSPRQERLAQAIAATGRAVGTGLCIGASLEFLAGAQARAPVWMQHAGMEWLFRLAREPVRLGRRYLWDSPPVLRLLLRERRRAAGQRGQGKAWPEPDGSGDRADLAHERLMAGAGRPSAIAPGRRQSNAA